MQIRTATPRKRGTSRTIILACVTLALAFGLISAPRAQGAAVTTDRQPSARAAIPENRIVQTGKRIYGTPAGSWSEVAYVVRKENYPKCQWRGMASIKAAGDYVMVADTCKDGKSAMAQVWYIYDGTAHIRWCGNPYGDGTVALCNFNWHEGGRALNLAAGVMDWPNGRPAFGMSIAVGA
ncbi:hypothetical protein [Pimelobacter simplex]|uniref:hypothetical protein n=1 Tax=Nocardioides simplex TaxID=2045 RepID=UPI003AACD25E